MVFVGEEKRRLMEDIKRFMLSQEGEFCQFPSVRVWVESTREEYKATLASVRRYFSLCKDMLEDEGLIEYVRTEKLNNGNVKKFYQVVRQS